eukprot:646674-Pelagomonas_calceolata.AAC.4
MSGIAAAAAAAATAAPALSHQMERSTHSKDIYHNFCCALSLTTPRAAPTCPAMMPVSKAARFGPRWVCPLQGCNSFSWPCVCHCGQDCQAGMLYQRGLSPCEMLAIMQALQIFDSAQTQAFLHTKEQTGKL